jgi:hypothetical protein
MVSSRCCEACRDAPSLAIGDFFKATAAARISRGEYAGWRQSKYPTTLPLRVWSWSLALCGDGCDGCDGCDDCDCNVKVVGEGDSPSALALNAAITSPRKVLFFSLDRIFSAVSGLLYHYQPYSTRTICPWRVYLLGASALSPTIGFQRVATLALVCRTTLARTYVRLILEYRYGYAKWMLTKEHLYCISALLRGNSSTQPAACVHCAGPGCPQRWKDHRVHHCRLAYWRQCNIGAVI